jgi:hypothetical protein
MKTLMLALLLGDAQEALVAATCRIMQGQASATGFLVAAEGGTVLVTAAHVLEGLKEPDCTLIVRDAKGARKEITVPAKEGDTLLWKRHKDLDVGAMPVTLPEGLAMKPLPLACIADEAWVESGKFRVGQELWMPCYPAGVEGNSSGAPILRKGSVATHPLSPLQSARRYRIDMPVFGGESGAAVAVCVGDEPRIVGVQVGMHRKTDKTSMPFLETTQHTPLGIGIVVQAPFIRDVIGLLGR